MTMRKPFLSRRTLLRGAGVGLGLPWLEAMVPVSGFASSADPRPPVRMAMLYIPNGVNGTAWRPEAAGRDFKLSPTLEPLKDLKDKVAVLSNLWNAANEGGDGHYAKEGAILTCTTIRKTSAEDIHNGVSMDQLAAQRVRHLTPIPSLELGVAPVATGVQFSTGYTRVYGSHIAWSSPTTPLAREIDPNAVYQRLFGAASGRNANFAKMDALLLDRVLEDAKRLRAEVGAADRLRLDEYMSVMRGLEERVGRAGNPAARKWTARVPIDPKAAPTGRPKDHGEHVRLMLDMIAVAFQSDATRISTFMFGNAVSDVNFGFIEGVKTAHHEASHHRNDPDKLRQYEIISR